MTPTTFICFVTDDLFVTEEQFDFWFVCLFDRNDLFSETRGRLLIIGDLFAAI